MTNTSGQQTENTLSQALRPATPNTLTGPEQWIRYEAMLTTSMLDDKELNDFVVFMYCKLNHPEMDYPKDLFE